MDMATLSIGADLCSYLRKTLQEVASEHAYYLEFLARRPLRRATSNPIVLLDGNIWDLSAQSSCHKKPEMIQTEGRG